MNFFVLILLSADNNPELYNTTTARWIFCNMTRRWQEVNFKVIPFISTPWFLSTSTQWVMWVAITVFIQRMRFTWQFSLRTKVSYLVVLCCLSLLTITVGGNPILCIFLFCVCQFTSTSFHSPPLCYSHVLGCLFIIYLGELIFTSSLYLICRK